MKKVFQVILVVSTALCFTLVGITSAGAQASKTALRMSWWGGDNRHKATLAAITLYEKQHPGVTIQGEYSGSTDGYSQKIKLQLAARTAPDIIQLDQPWLSELQTKGDFFVDLGHQKDLNLQGFDQTFLKSFCIVNGKIIALPSGIGGQTLMLNKTLGQKVGVEVDKLSDWETLLIEGKRLHAKDKEFYLVNHDSAFTFNIVEGFLKQITGKPVIQDNYTLGFTKADVVKVFNWTAEAIASGTFQGAGEASLYTGKREQNPKWGLQQDMAVTYDFISNLISYKLALPKDTEFSVFPMPSVKGAKTGSTLVRPSQVFVVNTKSANIGESVKFLNWFLNDKDAALVLADVRGVPASSFARDACKAAKKIDEMTLEATEKATANQSFPDSVLTHQSQIDEIFKDVTIKVEFGALKPEAAADELISRLNAKLSTLKLAAK